MCYCRALCTSGLYVKEWLHYWSPIKAEIRAGLLISINFERLFDLYRCLHRNQSAVSLLRYVAQPLARQIERLLRVCCWRSAREISAPEWSDPPSFWSWCQNLNVCSGALAGLRLVIDEAVSLHQPRRIFSCRRARLEFSVTRVCKMSRLRCSAAMVRLRLFGSNQKKKKKFKKSCIVKILLISRFRMASSSCHCPWSGMKVQLSQLLTVQDFLPPLCEGKAEAGVRQKIHLSKCIPLSAFKLCAGGYQNICISF